MQPYCHRLRNPSNGNLDEMQTTSYLWQIQAFVLKQPQIVEPSYTEVAKMSNL